MFLDDKHAKPHERKKVTFILGWGHSGSTLLEIALGTSPDVFSAGELCYLNDYYEETNPKRAPLGFVCTCGKRFRECGVWSKVLERIGSLRPHAPQNMSGRQRLSQLFNFFLANDDQGSSIEDDSVFKAIQEITGQKIIVDSSKNFSRLIKLSKSKQLDIRVIHLIRHPCAVCASYARGYRHHYSLKQIGIMHSALMWVGINLVGTLIARKVDSHYTSLRYEDFTSDPDKVIRSILNSLEAREPAGELVAEMNQSEKHGINGNKLRFHTVDRISPATDWKKKLNRCERCIVTLMGGWLYPFLRTRFR